MKQLIKNKRALGIFVLLMITSFSSCETTNLNLQNDPFELTEDSADPAFVFNGIQATFATQIIVASAIVEPLMDHSNLFGTFAGSAGTNAMTANWQSTYSLTSNLNFLKSLSENSNVPQHIGVSQILEAYSYILLVDYIGTAVYSEAVNAEFENPNLDSGESIYNAMYTQLDEAIINLGKDNSITLEDIFYNGDTAQWIKLANTLKLRMYVQSKLVATPDMVSALNNIITSGNYITEAEDDLVVQYGTSITNPDNRSVYFQAQYGEGQNAGNVYQSNGFMNLLLNTKTIADPRAKYYFYRQDLNDPIDDDIDHCTEAFNFCYLGNGYIGRDRGDDEGIPNDGETRVAYGIYPAGGAYDGAGTQTEETAIATENYDPNSGLTLEEHISKELLNLNPATSLSSNLGGEGIFPILTNSFVKFLLAEASLPAPQGMGASGSSITLLEEAIKASFNKVESVSGIPMDAISVDTYITEVLQEFTDASPEKKLEIIIREYYIANYGNSIEAYNAYRRTGYPDLQKHVLPSGGEFPRSFFIPASELDTNNNPNLVQKELTDQVFWDTNPAGFID